MNFLMWRRLRHRAQDDQETDASQAAGDQDGVAQGNARPHRENRAWVKQMLKGHLNYFAVSGNHPSLWWFFVKRLWLTSVKPRSQTARLNWERFIQLVDRFFPPIRTIHPLPCQRFDARTQGRSPVR
ncbi:hypothetical protein ACRQ5Q_43835 (plasmid) [Bradyrhizobium sp. PMVTL-01]|uniref:hypothetical protein n=1 Tax=Bradyrhizobium sp. PMVTL-01 TaxID=3434999 RepID=UPI003F6FBDF4